LFDKDVKQVILTQKSALMSLWRKTHIQQTSAAADAMASGQKSEYWPLDFFFGPAD
jgi:hypothetical protein